MTQIPHGVKLYSEPFKRNEFPFDQPNLPINNTNRRDIWVKYLQKNL